MDGYNSLTDSCSTTMATRPCSVSAIDSEDSCSTSSTTHPCSVSSTRSSISSEDLYEGYCDVSSIVSSKEIGIFSEDTDEETKEIPGKTLDPYQPSLWR